VPPELVAELRASLEDLAVTFPGIAELMLGTTEIDRTLEAVLSDARGAEAISALTRHVERGLDAMVARVIDLLMTGGGPTDAEQEALSERLNEALVAAEAMLQRILDEWIYPQMWDDSGRPPRQTDR
jgi:hypothetical protein